MIFRIQQDDSRQDDQGMVIVGMPETFWVVTRPTPNSELGDICFESDFKRFALQVRGGLKVENILGIYADQEVANATATKLLAAVGEQSDPDSVIHRSPFSDWYATQHDNHSVWICDKISNEKIQVEPPADWGSAWAWNIDESGAGIVMRRVK